MKPPAAPCASRASTNRAQARRRPRSLSRRSTSTPRRRRKKPEFFACIFRFNFECLRKPNRRNSEPMKTILTFCLIALVTFSIPQFAHAQENKEAAKLARDAAAAAKDQDFDKAVELARKASSMDNKYANSLAAALQQRGFAAASERRFPDAI